MNVSTIFEFKIIKLATSCGKHFLGHRLWQHFYKNATAFLGQLPFTAN